MNKYSLLMLLVIYLMLTSMMVSALGLAGTQINTPTTESAGTASAVLMFVNGIISIMFFNVEGVPMFINLVFFFWIPFVIGFMVVDIVINIIPFT